MTVRYGTVLFDLDGTLTDPALGITNAVSSALERYGIETPDRTVLYPFIGPPLMDSFQSRYGFDSVTAKQAVAFYREYYQDKGLYENTVYPGIPELLGRLREAGRQIVLATSKPEPFAERILSHFGLLHYFDFVAGATMDETRTKKDEVIRYALDACKIDRPELAVMVGDRCYDIAGGKQYGLATVGVLYGYGGRAELEAAGADAIAATVEELTVILTE